MVMTTSRLRFRPWNITDLQAFHAICSLPEVMQFIDGPWNTERVAEFICHEQQQFEQLSHCRWALELKSDRQLIGFCGLRPLKHDPHQLEIGWRLHSDFWRQGLGFEAASYIIRHALETLEPRRLFANIHVKNEASLSLAKKIGMHITERIPIGEFDDYVLDFPLGAEGHNQ